MTDLLSSRSEHKCSNVTTMRSPHIPAVRKANSLRRSGKEAPVSSPRRRVSFSRDVQIQTVILRSEISQDEFEATWYCQHEFRAMKKSLVPTIKKMAKGIPLDENEESRGLEHKTPEGSKKRCDNRFISLDAVLQEQDHQWEYDRTDPDALAKAYNQSSAHCLMQAYLKATHDADFVLKEGWGGTTSNEEKETRLAEDNSVEKIAAGSPISGVHSSQPCERLPDLQTPRVLSAAA
jgi:hypothetical protein